MSYLNINKDYDELTSLEKPIGFAEVGSAGENPIDLPKYFKDLGSKYPQMSFGVFWSGWSSLGGLVSSKKAIIENGQAKVFMNDPTIGTLTDINIVKKTN